MAVEVTRKEYLKLWRDDRYISQHTKIIEAVERASQDAETHESPGIYQVKIGDTVFYEVEVTFILGSGGEIEETQPPIPADEWPVNGWAMQGGYQISDAPANLGTDPYRTLNGEKDLLIYQWRRQTESRKADELTHLTWFSNNHPHCKMVQYVVPGELKKDGTGAGNYHTHELINSLSGYDGTTDWYLYNSSGVQVEAKFNPSVLWKANEAVTVGATNTGGQRYSQAFYEMWYDFFNENGRVPLIDGIYHDVTPPVPQSVTINDGATSTNFDYEKDGSATSRTGDGANDGPDLFRTGIMQWRTDFKTQFGATKAYLGNITRMGLDYDSGVCVRFPVSSNEYYQQWDSGIQENAHSPFSLERTGTGYTNDGGGNPVPLTGFRRLALIQAATKPNGSGAWEKSPVMIVSKLNNRTPLEIDYDMHRTWGAIAALSGAMLGAMRETSVPSEPLDEYVYEWGALVGSNSMGTLDLSDASFSLRAADFTSGGAEFHWVEFENVLWVLRTDWFAQGAGDNYGTGTAVNCELPSPGAGKKWIHPDLSNYTNARSGRSTRGQNNTLNSGNDVTAGGSHGVVSLKPTYAVMVAKADA